MGTRRRDDQSRQARPRDREAAPPAAGGRRVVPRALASEKAQMVLNYFGFRTVIIDNAIHPEDRKLFYELQDAGLLRSSWETVLLLNGRNWRIFYWELHETDVDRVFQETEGGAEPLYKALPNEAWTHPGASA